MPDEQTNETDTAGKKTDKPVADDKKDTETTDDSKTPSQKLKEENDALEKELVRAQKIRNEALLAGTAGGRVEPTVTEPTDEDIAEKFNKGELDILAHEK